METATTLEQMAQELEQVKRELREVKEKYAQTAIENKSEVRPSAQPQEVVTKNGTRIEYPTEHPHIYTSPEMHNSEPTIRGSRVTVRAIVERMRIGQDPLAIHKSLPHLGLAKIYDAISYYYDHTAEIDLYIKENEEAGWRALHRVSL